MPRPPLAALVPLAVLLTPGLLRAGPGARAVTPAPARASAKTPDEVHALLTHVDDLFRSNASRAKVRMHVRTKHFERTLVIEAYTKGTDRSLMRILSPAKDKGVTTLKVGADLWNYLPRVDRVIKVPASMMSGSWMGSHFTNDDLVRESRFDADYDVRLVERPKNGQGQWRLELTPKKDAAVVWGRIVVTLEGKTRLPLSAVYYDEAGKKVRTLTYSDVRSFSGVRLPARLTLVPEDKPGEFTEIVYESLELGVDLPDRLFSKQALTR